MNGPPALGPQVSHFIYYTVCSLSTGTAAKNWYDVIKTKYWYILLISIQCIVIKCVLSQAFCGMWNTIKDQNKSNLHIFKVLIQIK